MAIRQINGIYKVDYPRTIMEGLGGAAKDLIGKGEVSHAIGTGLPHMIHNAIMGTAAAKYTAKELPNPDSYKKGGKVKKTGLAYLHKGEFVIPKGRAIKKVLKKHDTRN